jgi:hypothetical protein
MEPNGEVRHGAPKTPDMEQQRPRAVACTGLVRPCLCHFHRDSGTKGAPTHQELGPPETFCALTGQPTRPSFGLSGQEIVWGRVIRALPFADESWRLWRGTQRRSTVSAIMRLPPNDKGQARRAEDAGYGTEAPPRRCLHRPCSAMVAPFPSSFSHQRCTYSSVQAIGLGTRPTQTIPRPERAAHARVLPFQRRRVCGRVNPGRCRWADESGRLWRVTQTSSANPASVVLAERRRSGTAGLRRQNKTAASSSRCLHRSCSALRPGGATR